MSGGLWDKSTLAASGVRPSLADRFVVPPVSTLNTQLGDWQDRRRQWLLLGIESELGRDLTTARAALQTGSDFDRGGKRRSSGMTDHGPGSVVMQPRHALPMTGGAGEVNKARFLAAKGDDDDADTTAAGTSVFDPVLCECAYRWWSPPGASVLDPFAGGSVRGLVAAYLGLQYTGVELRPEQVDANRAQAVRMGVAPHWVVGDSTQLDTLLPDDYQCDMLFTCPPYYNLEVYSDDPADLSNLPTYDAFLSAYRQVIVQAVARLRPDRYAVYVVSDVRDKGGMYYGLHSDTIRAFADAGLRLYNDAVLINSYGTLPLRVGAQFDAGRKLGRAHQNVVVFAKGKPEPRDWTLRMDVGQPPSPQLSLWDDAEVSDDDA